MSCYCTLCAGGTSSSMGSIRTRSKSIIEPSSSTSAPSYSVWGSLFSVLGVVVSPSLNSSLFSLCASCSSGLKELVGLKAQLTKLEEDCASKSAALRSLVANSAGWQHCFSPTASQLRAEVLGHGGYPYQSSGDIERQQQNNFQSFVQAEEQDLQPHPILLPSPPLCSTLYNQDSQISVDLNQGQNFIPVGASPPHFQEYHQPVNNADPDFEPDSNSHDLDADSSSSSEAEDESPSLQEDKEKDDSRSPPPKIRGNAGKMSEERRLAMLEKRSKTEVEKFSHVVTTEDGKKFYDNFEILTLPTGTMQCVTCGWKEGNDGTRPWLRIRCMKMHIKGFHQEAYKCNICAVNFTSLALLRKHDCGGENRKRGKRKPGFQCAGCQKLFLFRQSLSNHIKASNCRSLTKTGTPYHYPRVPCTICGRPVISSPHNLSAHRWTHFNAKEKAEATAAGQVPYTINKNKEQCQCPTCGKMISQAYFKAHLDLHKDAEEHEKRVICEVDGCGASFLNKKFLANHKKLKHAKKRIPVACPYPPCDGRIFASRSLLMSHTRRRHGEFGNCMTLNTCSICNAETYVSEDFAKHIRKHKKLGHTAEMFTITCSVEGCPQKVLSVKSLQIHMGRKHPKKKTATKSNKEKTEGHPDLQPQAENGENQQNLKNKSRKPKNRNKEAYRKKASLYSKVNASKRRVSEDLPDFIKLEDGLDWKLEFLGYTVFKKNDGYTCDSCGSQFNVNLDPLENHDDKEIEYEWNKVARQVKVHIKGIHREDYKCELCGRVTSSLGYMALHRKHHIEKDSIPCSICEESFIPSEMELHRWNHRRGVEEILSALNSGEKLPVTYLTNADHLVHSTQDKIPIKCDHCKEHEKVFVTFVQLHEHIVKNHPELHVDKNPKRERIRMTKSQKSKRKMEMEINVNNLQQCSDSESELEVKDEI